MKEKVDLQGFKAKHLRTLKTDPQNLNKRFIEVPIEDYAQLGCLHDAIIDAIRLIGIAHDVEPQGSRLRFTLKYLCHLLECTVVYEELEGMDVLENH